MYSIYRPYQYLIVFVSLFCGTVTYGSDLMEKGQDEPIERPSSTSPKTEGSQISFFTKNYLTLSASHYKHIACIYFRAQDYPRAAKNFDLFLESEHSNPTTRQYRGATYAHMRAGNTERYLELREFLLTQPGTNVFDYQAMALEYFNNKKFRRATKLYDYFLDRMGRAANSKDYRWGAELNKRGGYVRKAAGLWEKRLEIAHRAEEGEVSLDDLRHVALINVEIKHFHRAADIYEMILRRPTSKIQDHREAAMANYRAAKSDDAWLRQYDNIMTPRSQIIHAKEQRFKYENRALDYFHYILSFKEATLQDYRDAASCEHEFGWYYKAREICERILNHFQPSIVDYRRAAKANSSWGDFGRARVLHDVLLTLKGVTREDYQRAIELNHKTGYQKRAVILKKQLARYSDLEDAAL